MRVYSNQGALAALKEHGAVVTWGFSSEGGDSSSVAAQLVSGVVDVHEGFHEQCFAARKVDGAVVTWGRGLPRACAGDFFDSSILGLEEKLVRVCSCRNGADGIAMKTDGSLICWGDGVGGNMCPWGDVSLSYGGLAGEFMSVHSHHSGLAALRKDGAVVVRPSYAWADINQITYEEAELLSRRVRRIETTSAGFFAHKDDGSVVGWGLTRVPAHVRELLARSFS